MNTQDNKKCRIYKKWFTCIVSIFAYSGLTWRWSINSPVPLPAKFVSGQIYRFEHLVIGNLSVIIVVAMGLRELCQHSPPFLDLQSDHGDSSIQEIFIILGLVCWCMYFPGPFWNIRLGGWLIWLFWQSLHWFHWLDWISLNWVDLMDMIELIDLIDWTDWVDLMDLTVLIDLIDSIT